MKKVLAAATVLLVLTVGGCSAAVLLVGGAGAASAQPCSLSTGGGQSVTIEAGQTAYVRTIIGVGKTRGVPPKGWEVALAVGLQESQLSNLANDGSAPRLTAAQATVARQSLRLPNDGIGSDYDSLGLFQQRPSTGWGSPDQLMDPVYAATAFYGGPDVAPANPGLLDVPGWQDLDVTVAAQRVQRSATPTAYARWAAQAAQLVAANADAPPVAPVTPVTAVPSSVPGSGAATGSTQNAAGVCGAGGVIPVGGATGDVSAVLAQAAVWTVAPKGPLPYSWGGGTLDGPSTGIAQGAGVVGFDCSSYVRFSYFHGAGITLPRTSGAQYAATAGNLVETARTVVDDSKLAPGDLLFYGSASSIHHVALYAGNGQMYEEPHTGSFAHLVPVYGGDFFAATRPLPQAPTAPTAPVVTAAERPGSYVLAA